MVVGKVMRSSQFPMRFENKSIRSDNRLQMEDETRKALRFGPSIRNPSSDVLRQLHIQIWSQEERSGQEIQK